MVQQLEHASQIDRDIVEYRKVSGWAVSSVVLGVLSASAVIAPLLWLIPVIAIIVSLIAMWRIRTSQGQTMGWSVALLGFVLAIFFGAAGPARTITRNYWLETRAEHFARQFLKLLEQNRPLDAYQLTRPVATRHPSPVDATDPFAKEPDAKKDYEKFLQLDPVKTLLDRAQQAKIELSAHFYGGDERMDMVEIGYRIRLPDQVGSESQRGAMYAERTLAYGTGNEQWKLILPSAK